jgi:hypothetical protein
MIGLDERRQAVMAVHRQETLDYQRFGQSGYGQLTKEITAVQFDPVQSVPG